MFRLYRPLLVIMIFSAYCSAAKYQYQIQDGGFEIKNGPAYFNRPLFGTHEPSMLLSGDRPAFTYFSPTDLGKIGTLYIGLISAHGGKWLDRFAGIDSVYQPGLERYVLDDPLLDGSSLEVVAVPLSMSEGFTIRLRWIRPPSQPIRLVWAFGGASGYDANYAFRVDKLQLSARGAVRNSIHIQDHSFSLTSPTMKGQEIMGTCDLPGLMEIKDAGAVLKGPMKAETSTPSQAEPVVVFVGKWTPDQDNVHLLFTMRGTKALKELAADPAETFDESVKFYRSLTRTVSVKTPDPHFDLAVEATVISNDGLWDPPAILHGAMSWMEPYLGWRHWYGSDAFGFHDRVRSSIVAFTAQQVQHGDDRGGIPDMLNSGRVYYNMNEDYLDSVYYHYLWTGDRALLASLLPAIQGVLSWEKRRLDPDDDALYESCLNTWISDSHWYDGGDTTQASAAMYRGYQLAAEAAEAAGKNPADFLQEAERIRTAINNKLWMDSAGHYAEFIDRIGLKRIHAEPEMPTIYRPIMFGVTDKFQAYESLRFTETNLRNETLAPNGGRLVWSSNWAPNYDQHYTHSTYELAAPEVLNLALAYYRTGLFERAYELIKGVYAGMYIGAIPGGLSCHLYTDGRQRVNEEFGDSISLFARAAVEGVFGIRPEVQHDIIQIAPGFPEQWKDASITTPDLSYQFHKTDAEISLQVSTTRSVRIQYHIPVHGSVREVLVNGSPAQSRIDPGFGHSYVDVKGPQGHRSSLVVRFKPNTVTLRFRDIVSPGDQVTFHCDGCRIRGVKDPERILRQIELRRQSASGIVSSPEGPHTVFVLQGESKDLEWQPVNLMLRMPIEILSKVLDPQTGDVRFTLRNNTTTGIASDAKAIWTGKVSALRINIPAGSERVYTVKGNPQILMLGKNAFKITGLSNSGPISTSLMYWPETPAAKHHQQWKWKTLPLAPFYNDSLSTLLHHPFWSSEYSCSVCFDYMLEHLIGDRSRSPDARRLRAMVNKQGIFTTHYGIPFSQRSKGNDVVALSLTWKNFPSHVVIPVNSTVRKIYLLISAVTFPMQSQIANARVVVKYADGGESRLDLVNPTNFDNGWGGFGGNWHDASSGMEIIGVNSAKDQPAPHLGTILAEGVAPEPVDYARWIIPTHADIVDVDCAPARKVQSVEVEVLSNDIIVALLGATFMM